MNIIEDNYSIKQYMQEIVKDKLDKFNILTQWGEKDKKEFKILLEKLEAPFDKTTETTKSKGNRLEDLVEFIINKSFFFDIYRNISTATNEIDEVIVFSNKGKQALQTFDISRDLIPISEELFIGECKNYTKPLGVTYVGKFYSLLCTTDIAFGIIFTQKGLTGQSNGYEDAYGLTKILRMIEKYEHGKDFYIITFTNEDYYKLLEGITFFELVNAKKMEMQLGADYNKLVNNSQHDNVEKIKDIISELMV